MFLDQSSILTHVSIVICRTTGTAKTMASKDTNTKGVKPKIMDKPKPGPNYPNKAGQFVTDLNTALDLSQNHIHSYNPFNVENAYPDFISTYHKLLSRMEDYYSHADKETLLKIIKDVQCKLIRVNTAKDQEDCKKCPDPITGDAMVNKLRDLPNFSSIKAHHKEPGFPRYHCR